MSDRVARGLGGNIHYHRGSSLTIKAGPKREAGGRRRRAVEVLSGLDPWNKQRAGLAGWPLRQKTHRAAAGSLGLGSTFGGIKRVVTLSPLGAASFSKEKTR